MAELASHHGWHKYGMKKLCYSHPRFHNASKLYEMFVIEVVDPYHFLIVTYSDNTETFIKVKWPHSTKVSQTNL